MGMLLRPLYSHTTGGAQDLTGHNPDQADLIKPVLSQGLDKMTFHPKLIHDSIETKPDRNGQDYVEVCNSWYRSVKGSSGPIILRN